MSPEKAVRRSAGDSRGRLPVPRLQWRPENDQTAFIQEDAFYLTVVCSQMAQRLYILTLVNDQHDQRTDDIETGNDQNKSQEKIGDQLFYPHDAIGICLLFITVFHSETVAQMFFQLTLDHARIGIRLQFQTDRTDFRGVLEQATGKRQGGQNVGSIVFS